MAEEAVKYPRDNTKRGRCLAEKDEDSKGVTLDVIREYQLMTNPEYIWVSLQLQKVVVSFESDAESEEAWEKWQSIRPNWQKFMDDVRAIVLNPPPPPPPLKHTGNGCPN